jgi:hypothetical protein
VKAKPLDLRAISFSFKTLILALLTVFAALNSTGQEAKVRPSPTPERPRDIVALLFDARLAAPELAVDTLLRVIESKKIIDVAWRREILEDALRLAEDVKNPVQLWPIPIRGVAFNNTEGYIVGSAHVQKLDRLSLKGRIISQFLDTDRERARQLVFEMSSNIGLKPRTCNDDLRYDVREIYSAVSKVAKAAFNQKQIVENQRALFLSPWMENIDSPAQIAPALDLVDQIQGTPSERQILISAFSRAIRKSFNDDRSFTAVVEGGGLDGKFSKFLSGESHPLKVELASAYREFLTRNLRSKRCKDNELTREEPMPKFIESANKHFTNPLTFDDIATSEYDSRTNAIDLLARSTSAQKLRDELFSLKGKVVDNKIVNESGPEWESRVTQFVDNILSWKGTSGETVSQEFHIKANLFGALLQSIDRQTEINKSVYRKYLRFISTSEVQRTSFIEWFMYASQMQKSDPELFAELAPELPNTNLSVILATTKLLSPPTKENFKP